MQLYTVVEDYVNAAMRCAVIEKLDDGTVAASVPQCQGVLAFGADVHECAAELFKRLEDWVKVSLTRGYALPVIDGIDLNTEANRILVTYRSSAPTATENDFFENESELEAAFDNN